MKGLPRSEENRMEIISDINNISAADSFIKKRTNRCSMVKEFNIIIEQGEDGYLISEVIELPGCHTQAKSYDELIVRTKEAISLYLKSVKKPFTVSEKFIGIQKLAV